MNVPKILDKFHYVMIDITVFSIDKELTNRFWDSLYSPQISKL